MANPGQPTVKRGDSGEAVRQAQRALRRTPDTTLEVDGDFGPLTETATKEFQQSAGLSPTGVVDQPTWTLLPNGNAMPVLAKGAKGDVVSSLQEVLTRGAAGTWTTTPKGVDGSYGSNTEASVRAFQTWIGLPPDSIVGQQTWDAAISLESMVGLQYSVGPKSASAEAAEATGESAA